MSKSEKSFALPNTVLRVAELGWTAVRKSKLAGHLSESYQETSHQRPQSRHSCLILIQSSVTRNRSIDLFLNCCGRLGPSGEVGEKPIVRICAKIKIEKSYLQRVSCKARNTGRIHMDSRRRNDDAGEMQWSRYVHFIPEPTPCHGLG